MNSPEVSIIIVNWNGADLIEECLRSIVENPSRDPFEIVVVDNASTDGSAEWLRSDDCAKLVAGIPYILIEPGTNLGYGPANNLAIERTDSTFVLILNSDTRIVGDAVDTMVALLQSDERIGMVGPALFYEDGKRQDSVSRQPESPLSILVEHFHLYRILPGWLYRDWLLGSHWPHDRRRAVPVIAGAAMMCRRRMIEDIGAFDPTIHMYAEDLEWCVRASRGGWLIYFEPSASIVHLRGKSTSQRWTGGEHALVQEAAMIYYENKTFSRSLNIANGITRVTTMFAYRFWRKFARKDASVIDALLRLRLENCKKLFFGDGGTV
jgi:GT2 family glycosyltransferase